MEKPFFPITVIEGSDEPWDEELFGPCFQLFRAEDEEHALKLANMGNYGLGSSVWSQSAKGEEFSDKIRSGIGFVNSVPASDYSYPTGGVANSGFGRECGSEGYRQFANIKTHFVNWFDYPIITLIVVILKKFHAECYQNVDTKDNIILDTIYVCDVDLMGRIRSPWRDNIINWIKGARRAISILFGICFLSIPYQHPGFCPPEGDSHPPECWSFWRGWSYIGLRICRSGCFWSFHILWFCIWSYIGCSSEVSRVRGQTCTSFRRDNTHFPYIFCRVGTSAWRTCHQWIFPYHPGWSWRHFSDRSFPIGAVWSG